MKRMVLTFAPVGLFLLFSGAPGCENKDASQGVPPSGTETIEAQPKPGSQNVAPVEDDPGLPAPKSTRRSVSFLRREGGPGKTERVATSEGVRLYRDGKEVAQKSLYEALCQRDLSSLVLSLLGDFDSAPSAEIEAKVKEMALLESDYGRWVSSRAVRRLHSWDYGTQKRFRFDGYPVRGKPADGLAVWLLQVPSCRSPRILKAAVRIDNLGQDEVHLYPDTTSWVLLECRPGAPTREIYSRNARRPYTDKTYHVIPARRSITLSFVLSLGALPYAGQERVRSQIILRSRGDAQTDPQTWVGEAGSPEFDIVVPPPKGEVGLEPFREFLKTSRKRGSFPSDSQIRWRKNGRGGLRLKGNRIAGGGIWLANPEDLRKLSAQDVRTICDFLLRDDTFAKGTVKAKRYMGKYPPIEGFRLTVGMLRREWRGNWLNRPASEQWKKIRDDLLRGRLEEARGRIRRDAQPPADNKP